MIPIDVSLLGMVFTLIVFIIFFSAIVLYLAFRIKETFRREKGRGALVTRVLFLIGVLFLAGGGFYFFAETLRPQVTPQPDGDGRLQLSLSVSYPSRVGRNEEITISFIIGNPSDHTAHGAVIQTETLFEYFTIVSSTHKVVGNVIEVGDIPPGTTIVSLELKAPNKSSDVEDTVTLTFQEMDQPVTENISISVRGKP